MKTKLNPVARILTLAAVGAGSLLGAPLAVPTAVHTKPDASSPAITFLKAGTEPSAALNAPADLSPGWIAVELPGPFEGYVENKDLTKSLDVKPGTPIRLAPKADAGVLTVAEKGDKVTISGLKGKWTQLSVEKKITGFANVGGTTGLPAVAATPAAGGLTGTLPAAPAVQTSTQPGQAAPSMSSGDGGSSVLPRQFAGRFVSTRRAFAPRRPYEFALNDDAGKRYAYVDTSKLLLTEQIEKYIDKKVVVFGAAKPVPDTKDIVIIVETLRLQ